MSEQDSALQTDGTSVSSAPSRSPVWLRLAGFAAGILLVVGVLAAGLWLATRYKSALASPARAANETPVPAATVPATQDAILLQRNLVSEEGLVDRIGVRIVYVAVTAEGGLIDMRYQIVDPDKAGILHEDTNPPILIDETTGAVVDSLLMGHSHTGNFNAGQTYYMIFENPGNLLQRGGEVSILLGDAEVEHVIVK